MRSHYENDGGVFFGLAIKKYKLKLDNPNLVSSNTSAVFAESCLCGKDSVVASLWQGRVFANHAQKSPFKCHDAM